MTFYQKQIIEATGCTGNEVREVEDILRNTILHSTLDWICKADMIRYSREAYEVYKCMKSEAGKAYMKKLEA
jgi:hypothetical protein